MGSSSSSQIVNQKSEKFFSDLSNVVSTHTLNDDINELSEKIKLKVLISQIENGCSYEIKLYNINYKEKLPLNESGACSFQDDTTIVLDTPILIRYFFEKEQPLLVEIKKTNSGISKKYEFQTTLGCIMGSRKTTLQKKSSTGNDILILQAEKMKPNQDIIIVKFDLSSNKDILFNDTKVKIYYEILSDKILYRSECINDEGKFNPIKIPLDLFNNNKINIKFYNNNKKVIEDSNMSIFEFINEKIFNIKVYDIPIKILSKSRVTKNFTFIDYLKAGVQIGLSIAIDFTGSNGKPYFRQSLHFIDSSKPNQYERAINFF